MTVFVAQKPGVFRADKDEHSKRNAALPFGNDRAVMKKVLVFPEQKEENKSRKGLKNAPCKLNDNIKYSRFARLLF